MNDTILAGGCCGSDNSCSANGCTGVAATCKKDDCCKKGTDKKTCSDCGTELKSGEIYKDICTTCMPHFGLRHGRCERLLWDCICIKESTWE